MQTFVITADYCGRRIQESVTANSSGEARDKFEATHGSDYHISSVILESYSR